MRKQIVVPIPPDEQSRDAGKKFLITEMPVYELEMLATRLMLRMTGSSFDLSSLQDKGAAGLAEIGLKALSQIPMEDAEHIIKKLRACVRSIPPDERKTPNGEYFVLEGEPQIEEASTVLKLRIETVKLHLGFLQAVGVLKASPSAVQSTSGDM